MVEQSHAAAEHIIAEIGSVHDGSFGNACKLIETAAACGADIVKFQTHIAEAETLRDAPMPPYFKGEPRYEYFERTAFSPAEWKDLQAHCEAQGVDFMSSPFSLDAVELLEDVGVSGFKLASGEVTDLPLVERLAETGKTVYVSSGMSDWAELDAAVSILQGQCPVVVMQCSSLYPCPPERVGLNVLDQLRGRYGCAVGFSDHTFGSAAAIAAAALGATVIEKHLTFSQRMYGSDAANAMEPEAFADYCRGIRDVWKMLAHPVDKDDLSPYGDMKRIFERSVVTARPLAAGHTLSSEDLAFKKPAGGIPAARHREVVGRRLAADLPKDHLLTEDDLV